MKQNHIIRRGWTLLITAILLGGCYPAKTVYFEPSAKGGTVASPTCHGSVGPRDQITFKEHGLAVSVSVWKLRDDDLRIFISLVLPANRSVILESQDVLTRVRSQQMRFSPVQIKGYTLRPHAEERIDNLGRVLDPKLEVYSLSYEFPPNVVDEFELKLPAISVDGQEINLPEITFVRKKEWFIYPLNC